MSPPPAPAEPAEVAKLKAADRRKFRLGLIGVILCLLIGAGVTWWYAGLRNRFYPDNFGVVVPGKVFRSAQVHRKILRKTLEDHHITVIVNLSFEENENARAERRIASEMGVTQINLLGLAGNGIGKPEVYPAAVKAIVEANRAGKAVLVHCQSGAQRTGGVIILYRILVEGKSKEDAFAEAKRFHHSPHSNPLLFPFLEEHLAEWRAKLEAEGVIGVGEDTTK